MYTNFERHSSKIREKRTNLTMKGKEKSKRSKNTHRRKGKSGKRERTHPSRSVQHPSLSRSMEYFQSLFFSFRGNTPPSLSPAYRTPIDKTRIGVLVREVSSDRVGIRPRGKANVRKRGRENRTFRARALLYPLPPRRRVRFVSLQSRLAPRAGSMRFITSLLSDNFFPLPKTDQR